METALYVSNLLNTVLDMKESQATEGFENWLF